MFHLTLQQVFLGLSCLALTALSIPTQNHTAAAVCQELAKIFRNDTVLPSQSNYIPLSEENWSETAWANPSCIVQPSRVAEIQQILRVLTSRRIPFAIRSGGHMPSPLAANINDGVLIDMALFREVSYEATKHVAKVGVGQRWRDVYNALNAYRVTVVGGRVLDVGVGGFVLGCGLSYLSDLHGLACDNVVNFEVVLASGSIVNANANSHSDLWWALKGGSNNFGIVTSFTLSTYPIYEVWGGTKSYDLGQLPALFSAFAEYQSQSNKDPYANLIMQGFTTNASIGTFLNMVYLKPQASPSAFKAFENIPTVSDTTKIQTLNQFIGGQLVPQIPRFDWFTTTFKPSPSLYSQVEKTMTAAPEVNTIASLNAGSLALALQPISLGVIEAGDARGGNTLGLQAINQTWFALDVAHWLAKDDQCAHNATKSLHAKIEFAAKNDESYLPYLFMNDASYDQNVITHYGEANVRRMKAVQRKYDPNSIFQKLVPGGFKLP